MVEFLNYIFFLLELFYLIKLIIDIGIKNVYVIVYFTVFYYAQSVFLDYLFLGKDNFSYTDKNIFISFHDIKYIYVNACYFLFLQTLFILTLRNKDLVKYYERRKRFIYGRNISFYYSLFLLLYVIYIIFYLTNIFGLSRSEIGEEQNAITLVLYNLSIYTGIFVLVSLKKQNWVSIAYIVALVISLVFSFEREPLVVFGLIFIFRYSNKLSNKALVLVMPLGLLVLSYYKLFFSTVLYSTGGGLQQFQLNYNDTQFSFAGVDPLSSFALLYDYFNKNIYGQYTFSYINDFYQQLHRTLFGGNYKSLSEYASSFYTYNSYGLAFSMILESILNFSFLGPVILAIALSAVYKKIYKSNSQLITSFLVVITFMSIKLVRTEFITLVKIHLIPAIIAYVLFYRLNKDDKELLVKLK